MGKGLSIERGSLDELTSVAERIEAATEQLDALVGRAEELGGAKEVCENPDCQGLRDENEKLASRVEELEAEVNENAELIDQLVDKVNELKGLKE